MKRSKERRLGNTTRLLSSLTQKAEWGKRPLLAAGQLYPEQRRTKYNDDKVLTRTAVFREGRPWPHFRKQSSEESVGGIVSKEKKTGNFHRWTGVTQNHYRETWLSYHVSIDYR
jgi:hypothetical protein